MDGHADRTPGRLPGRGGDGSQATAEQLDVRALGLTLVNTTEAAGDPSLWTESHGTAYERVSALADGILDLSRCQLTGDGHYYPQPRV